VLVCSMILVLSLIENAAHGVALKYFSPNSKLIGGVSDPSS
jgi:hypothetical protein